MVDDAAPAPASARFTAPDVYTPGHLAEKILTSRAALEGERKQVTVLFADLKGSMELLADRDPEEARKILDPVLERMMEAVHRYEGTVNQVLGDGIMALFGAPLAHEDHAVRACYAALTMHETVGRYADELRRTQGADVQIRVGVNSGEVVVRSIGSDLHMDYSAIGQTTHLAARMEQLVRPGHTLVTNNTLRLAEGYVEVHPLGPVPIKGLAEPVEVFELVQATAARSRLHAAVKRGLSRFVGRDREIDQLRAALDRVSGGHGEIVSVVGEPGVGKSRLFWEFTHSRAAARCLALESSSFSYGKATPYLPLRDLLRRYFAIESGDDVRRVKEKVAGKVVTLDRSLEDVAPIILDLLETEPGATVPVAEGSRRQRVVDAVRRLLLAESRVQPLLVIFEDLHWIDEDTQAFLDAFAGSLPAAPALLLVNYRPEYRHGWGQRTYYTQLRLDPLPAESADELLGALVGDDAALVPLKRLLIQRTEGNPLFLEEMVRTLVETHALEGAPGAYRLTKSFDAFQVPATVEAVLAARIDRLPHEEKTLLQTAAVIGKDVPITLLAALTESSEDTLRHGLAHLQTAEFLYETSLFPELEYTFRHALTHEVAYGSLLQERRRALHARVVETFEALHPDRIAERVHWLAQHAFRGEVWDRALAYLKRTESEAPPTLDAFFGGLESIGYLWWTGDYERAVTVGTRDLVIAVNFRDFGRTVAANFRLGQIHHSLGDYPRAIEHLLRATAPLEGDLAYQTPELAGLPAVFARAWLALCRAEQGEVGEARTLGAEAISIAETAAHDYSLIVACFALGSVHLLANDLANAIGVLERGLALARVQNVTLLTPFVGSPLGLAYARAGRIDEGLSLLQEGVDQAIAMKLAANHALRLLRLAEGHRLAGNLDRARAVADAALEVARRQQERGHEAHTLAIAAEITSDALAFERAVELYGAAADAASALGMKLLYAHANLGVARVYERLGRTAEANDAIARATEVR